jgi:hypothetical protein
MVFATGASAFLHLNEHLHADADHQHLVDADHQHPDGSAHEADHAHHFNLHVVGDLVEHDCLSFIKAANLISGEVNSPLVSRTYTPPIPPPNA